jgi:TetR/AcrR family transcriptional repressor of nem operon
MSYTPKAQRTRSRILDCAAERMFAQGYGQLKLDDVLLDAQVRKGNFYYYFASKDDLCLSVLKERARPLLLDWIAQQVNPLNDPWQNLTQLTQAVIDDPDRVPEQGNPLANLALEMAGISEEFRREVALVVDEMVGIYAREFRRLQQQGRLKPGADPQQIAKYLFSVVEGASLLYRCHRDREQFERTVHMGMAVAEVVLVPVA